MFTKFNQLRLLVTCVNHVQNKIYTVENRIESSMLMFSKLQGCSLASIMRQIHSSLPRNKDRDKTTLMSAGPLKDYGTTGEKAINVDALIQR